MINPKVQFTKIRDVHSPSRANSNDAGTDFFVPYYSQQFMDDLVIENGDNIYCYSEENSPLDWKIVINPHCRIVIPSGIKLNILDKNTYLEAKNKGGVATNLGLVYTAHVVDADFQGELFIGLLNTTNEPVEIKTGQKIIQLVQKEYIKTEWEEISNEEYNNIKESDRGTGQRGSSGTH